MRSVRVCLCRRVCFFRVAILLLLIFHSIASNYRVCSDTPNEFHLSWKDERWSSQDVTITIEWIWGAVSIQNYMLKLTNFSIDSSFTSHNSNIFRIKLQIKIERLIKLGANKYGIIGNAKIHRKTNKPNSSVLSTLIM